jgi:hypothetical protein
VVCGSVEAVTAQLHLPLGALFHCLLTPSSHPIAPLVRAEREAACPQICSVATVMGLIGSLLAGPMADSLFKHRLLLLLITSAATSALVRVGPSLSLALQAPPATAAHHLRRHVRTGACGPLAAAAEPQVHRDVKGSQSDG